MNTKLLEELTGWRHYLHEHPETAFEEVNTSKFVAEKMREMGYDVHTQIGKTGVVASLTNGDSPKTIGIRADMDALNILEKTKLPYASLNEGKMHACGHDGHVVTALGAAKLLAESKDFNGTVRFIFQPAEEHGKGALAMLEDGLFERFPIDEFYGLHNMPALPEGEIHSKVGPIMASEDNFQIKIKGIGGHASAPNQGKDPLVVAAEIILALQTVVSRNVDPVDTAVVSCTEIHTDGIINAIPSNVVITGDTRSYKAEVQQLLEHRMRLISEKICEANEVECDFSYTNSFSPTNNWEQCHEIAVQAAKNVVGEEKVNDHANPIMASEDFGHFLDIIPGCFVFLGGNREGVESYPLHHAKFDYKDENLLEGAEFFAEIVRLRLT
ncbi:M20 aminoacylase family protein [Enterococcus sp. HY326]|uniref:M20 aminoacylase family protein n=1 Tax=Enterococcus sp. HY326 TaxID=2971265 RepID=UPI00223FF190|nr:M20 aminoacylase family protein [Enterococcus sp. HY326]